MPLITEALEKMPQECSDIEEEVQVAALFHTDRLVMKDMERCGFGQRSHVSHAWEPWVSHITRLEPVLHSKRTHSLLLEWGRAGGEARKREQQ